MRVRRLSGERFQPDCQAASFQAGWGSFHVMGGGGGGAFHKGVKSPLVLLDRNANDVVYRGWAFHKGVKSPLVLLDRNGNDVVYRDICWAYNPIRHLWDELGRTINNMDHPPHNLDELRQACWISGPISLWSAFILPPVQVIQIYSLSQLLHTLVMRHNARWLPVDLSAAELFVRRHIWSRPA